MSTVKKFTELEIWQLANELDKKVHQQINTGTLAKDFSLKDQISRSAGSVSDNIAEGFGRGGRIEFIQYLSISRGSVSELQSQLSRCLNRNYISKEIFEEINLLADKTGNKIGAFIKYLNQSNYAGTKFKDRKILSNKQSDIKNVQPTPDSKQHTTNDKQQTTKKIEQSALSDQHTRTPNPKPKTPNNISETVVTKSAASPLGSYPHARRVGNLLFLSGIGPRNAIDNSVPGLKQDKSGKILKHDIEAECHAVFANVKAVLEASGSAWEKIIDVTVFLTHMKKDFPVYNKIYNSYFAGVQACRTTVEVKSLPTPIAIELKVIAMVD